MSDCRSAPALTNLRREMDTYRRGWRYLGTCGDKAHRARKSDHNPTNGYAHAIDLGEGPGVPSMQWLVDRIMANPALYPQVKYLIYEGHIYYPHDGARKRGKYVYTGPNSHASHLHISIHTTHTHYTGSWHILSTSHPAPSVPARHRPRNRMIFVKHRDDHPTDPARIYVVDADCLKPVPNWSHFLYLAGETGQKYPECVRICADDDGVWGLPVHEVA